MAGPARQHEGGITLRKGGGENVFRPVPGGGGPQCARDFETVFSALGMARNPADSLSAGSRASPFSREKSPEQVWPSTYGPPQIGETKPKTRQNLGSKSRKKNG